MRLFKYQYMYTSISFCLTTGNISIEIGIMVLHHNSIQSDKSLHVTDGKKQTPYTKQLMTMASIHHLIMLDMPSLQDLFIAITRNSLFLFV